MHYRTAQEMFEPTPNVIPINRKRACVEVNRAAAELLVLSCCDEDLDALCRDLGEEVVKTQQAYDVAREAFAKALNEKSRRAGR